ncbi:MAG: recombinase [Eubacteriales bacterium]
MSHVPYGYRIENGKAVIDEEKAAQVRKLYEGYLSGLAYVTAAEAAGLTLYHTGAKKMMQNKRYLGDDYYPAIIDNETFVAAEAERVKRQAKLGRVFDDKPAKVSKIAKGFKMPKVQMKYDDPFKQAEYVYSLIESEEDV